MDAPSNALAIACSLSPDEHTSPGDLAAPRAREHRTGTRTPRRGATAEGGDRGARRSQPDSSRATGIDDDVERGGP
jgi:hypothetical protein